MTSASSPGRFDDGADDGAGGERERVRAERDADRRIRRGDGAGGGRGDAISCRRGAEEATKAAQRLMEPLALMQQPATGEPEEETVRTDDVVTGADAASAGAIESTEDATESARRARRTFGGRGIANSVAVTPARRRWACTTIGRRLRRVAATPSMAGAGTRRASIR